MSHEMFRLAKASERELDLIVYGGAAGALIMLLLVGFLAWRGRHKLGKSPRLPKSRAKKPKRR
jgi:uncharacterized iron-regulated membrane protein